MGPSEKLKPKKHTDTVADAPVSGIRTRSASAPPSLVEILEGLQGFLTPQLEELRTDIKTASTSVENRLMDLENTVDFLQADHATTNQHLQNQMSTVLTRLDLLEQENHQLRATNQQPTEQTPYSNQFPALELGTATSKHAPITPVSGSNVPSPSPRTGGMRLFTPVSANQGFQYLYLPLRGRKPYKEIRTELKKANINSGSVVDIHYPTSKVVAVLVHNDFAQKAIDLLRAENVQPIKNFDPLDPAHLADPVFKDASIEERTQQMKIIFDNQKIKTLDFLRPPVKLAVARDFCKKGLITTSYLNDLVALHSQSAFKPTSSEPPIFQQTPSIRSSDDTDMDAETPHGQSTLDSSSVNIGSAAANSLMPMDSIMISADNFTEPHNLAGIGEPASTH